MQPSSNNQDQTAPDKKLFFNLPEQKILLQAGLYLGVIIAFLLLAKGSDVCIATINSCTGTSASSVFLALGGGAAVLFGLTTLLGVPLLPAAGIGLAVWWLIQASLS